MTTITKLYYYILYSKLRNRIPPVALPPTLSDFNPNKFYINNYNLYYSDDVDGIMWFIADVKCGEITTLWSDVAINKLILKYFDDIVNKLLESNNDKK